MTAITMDKVKLTGIMNIDRVLQFTAHAIANEHAHMYFEGIVAAADGREYMSMPMAGQEMQLKCDVEGTDKPYFAGQVLRAVIAEEGGLFTVKCECISGSYRFDLSKKSRSFQYTPTTYAEMFKWIQDKDKIGNILVIKGADTQIGYPIIQYEETDWEFAKRMAGHFGTVVLPEITDGFPQMSVGVIKGNTYEIGENSRYEEGKRIAAYRKKNPVSPCALTDFRTMRVMDYRNFELGDKVNFKGETWIVMGKEIRMVQSLLEVWYVLGLEQGYGLPKHYNAHISGMSILGEVIYTDHENLKIHLDIDEKQDVEKAYKYTWMPATGNLMYCMPKLGTRVSLYMPDSHEGNAYATECVRTNGGTACGEMADYNVRQFLTEHDKRMTMAPASMQFVGSSKENNNIVRLEDEKGLYFDSQQPIYMQSSGNFIVSAGGKVNVQSNKNIVVHKSRVKSGFELSGSEVNIYAKKFYRNGQTSGAAGPLAAETASGTPFPFGLMIGALLAMLPFAANPNDESIGGKQPANTGRFPRDTGVSPSMQRFSDELNALVDNINKMMDPITLTNDEILNNYKYNCTQDLARDNADALDATGHIINQGILDNWKFGNYAVQSKGCASIATYNALVSMGEKPDYASIIKYYDSAPIPGEILGGTLGTFPKSVESYFRDNGYDVSVSNNPLEITKNAHNAETNIMFYAGTSSEKLHPFGHYIEMIPNHDSDRFSEMTYHINNDIYGASNDDRTLKEFFSSYYGVQTCISIKKSEKEDKGFSARYKRRIM